MTAAHIRVPGSVPKIPVIKVPDDKFKKAARERQKRADFPGCKKGLMNCVDWRCDCQGLVPSEGFVSACAQRLREGKKLYESCSKPAETAQPFRSG